MFCLLFITFSQTATCEHNIIYTYVHVLRQEKKIQLIDESTNN